jgi:hypothetical protein
LPAYQDHERILRQSLVLLAVLVLAAGTGYLALHTTSRASGTTVSSPQPVPPTSTRNMYVNPKTVGSGDGSTRHPYRTIQDALDVAVPGSVIHLEPGVYDEMVKTEHDGTAARPIVVEGDGTGMSRSDHYRTVLYGTGHIFTVQNDWYTLRGFAIDGQLTLERHHPMSTWPDAAAEVFAFKQGVQDEVSDAHPLVVDGGSDKDVTGTVIDDMWISGGGGECVRFRDGATDGIVENSTIEWCGLKAHAVSDTYPYHNGEGVYIGTSPKSSSESRHEDDPTNHITVEGDHILTFGSECVDIKENAYDNVVRSTMCADNQEPLDDTGSNLEIRGYGNTIEGNTIVHSQGYGVKIAVDGVKYDNRSNVVRMNTFSGQVGAAIYDPSPEVQGRICGNVFSRGRGIPAFERAC